MYAQFKQVSFNNFEIRKTRFEASIENSFPLADSMVTFTRVPKFPISIFKNAFLHEYCNTWRIYASQRFPLIHTEVPYFKKTPEGTTITDDALNFLPSLKATLASSGNDSYILTGNVLRDSPNLLIRNILDSGI